MLDGVVTKVQASYLLGHMHEDFERDSSAAGYEKHKGDKKRLMGSRFTKL